jgi:hypothetical protein
VRELRDSTSFYIRLQDPDQSSLRAVQSERLCFQSLQTSQAGDIQGKAGVVLVVVVVAKLGEKVWELWSGWGRGGGSG